MNITKSVSRGLLATIPLFLFGCVDNIGTAYTGTSDPNENLLAF